MLSTLRSSNQLPLTAYYLTPHYLMKTEAFLYDELYRTLNEAPVRTREDAVNVEAYVREYTPLVRRHINIKGFSYYSMLSLITSPHPSTLEQL